MVKPATTKLSSRGQVVIPEEIRNRLGLEEGAQFVVVGEGDVVVLKALKAPIQMVTAPHAPVPFSPDLEDIYIPGPDKIEAAVRKTMAS